MPSSEDSLRHTLTVIANELNSVESRLRDLNSRSVQIIQYSLLLVGAAVIAAQEFREVFVIIPVFWSVWLLYSLTADRDTVKNVVYAEHLEECANQTLELLDVSREDVLGKRVFGFRLALRGHGSNVMCRDSWKKSHIYNASQVCWAIIILASNVLAFAILAQRDWWYWIIALAVYQLFVGIAAYRTLGTRARDREEFRKDLKRAVEPTLGSRSSNDFP